MAIHHQSISHPSLERSEWAFMNLMNQPPLTAATGNRLVRRIVKNRAAYLFVLPILCLLGVFKYYPFFWAIIESFFDWNAANVNDFVGFSNYKDLLDDQVFHQSLRNMGIYSFVLLTIQLVAPLVAAMLVFNLSSLKIQNLFKIGFVVPMIVPHLVIILMWKWVYAGDYGILNRFLGAAGLDSLQHAWLGDSATALGAILFVNFPWVAGLPFLIYLAGLQSISQDLFESSQIDGATGIRRIIHMDLPLIKSQTKLVVMYTLIQAVQVFEPMYVLTNGGPGTSTISPALHLYEQAFLYNKFGYASAIGVVLFLIILILTIVSNKYMKNTDKID